MTSGNDVQHPRPRPPYGVIAGWTVSSFVAVLLLIFGVRMVLVGESISTRPTQDLPSDQVQSDAGADQDRAAVVFDPHADDAQAGVNDNRSIFWTYGQFQLLDQHPKGEAAGPAPERWMIDDKVLSTSEVAAYMAGQKQSIRQQGGLEFVCYNADYLGGIQGRLETWSGDASSDDWVELNRLPKEVAEKFMTEGVFPAPEATDYQHCRAAVDGWNELVGA